MKSDCILHAGKIVTNGYGRVGKMYAHRAAWEVANGQKVPKGMDVMHSCDVRACVNPEHLSVGTRQQNLRDMHARGRWVMRNPLPRQVLQKRAAKITQETADEIRRRVSAGETQASLGREFGLARPTVCNIVKNVTWIKNHPGKDDLK